MGGQRDGKKASGAEQHKVKFSMAKRGGIRHFSGFYYMPAFLNVRHHLR